MLEKCEVVSRVGQEIVVRVHNCVKMHARVFDANRREVGRVIRVFGPVASPYALVALNQQADADGLFIRC
ncbi:Gar1/Naf1 family protein [Thermogymnomonas acidicola]|nr:Gar1/Naf1 family protein [Thermogymnomonas acidicola]